MPGKKSFESDFNEEIKNSLVYEKYNKFLKNVPLFKRFNDRLIALLCTKVESKFISDGEIVVEKVRWAATHLK